MNARTLFLASSLLGLLAACGGPKVPAEDPSDAEPLTEGPAEPAPSVEPAAPAPEAPPAQEAEPDAKFREITQRECSALGGKYGELTRSDETAKLSPKLTAAQKQQAADSINAAAEKLEARWVESCSNNLVGKVAEEAAIMCGMNARNVAAFDTCLNGPN